MGDQGENEIARIEQQHDRDADAERMLAAQPLTLGGAMSNVGAVAGVAQAAGQLIGGTGGAALSGAASGAAAGMTFGGGVRPNS